MKSKVQKSEVKKESVQTEKVNKYRSGIPMTEKEYAEWQKAFTDIEECIEALYKTEKKAYNKSNKPKRRNQV